MPAPTFVSENESAYNVSTSPKTVSTTWAANDVIVVTGIGADGACTLGTPTATGLTFALQQSVVLGLNTYSSVYVWTAVAASGDTQNVSISTTANPSANPWGFTVYRFSDSAGVGASAKNNVNATAPSLAVTTTVADSALVVVNADWNAADGTTRTWRTVNSITPTLANTLERTYFRDAAQYTAYSAYYNNAGTAGSKTVGLSAPTGQKSSLIVVEVKGASSSVIRPRITRQAVRRAATR